jgi:hypothetical protein
MLESAQIDTSICAFLQSIAERFSMTGFHTIHVLNSEQLLPLPPLAMRLAMSRKGRNTVPLQHDQAESLLSWI